jgi:hypothetical protein
VAQAADGTSRAWLALSSANVWADEVTDRSLESRARQAVLDGCGAALATGVDRAATHDAYTALWVALLAVEAGV